MQIYKIYKVKGMVLLGPFPLLLSALMLIVSLNYVRIKSVIIRGTYANEIEAPKEILRKGEQRK